MTGAEISLPGSGRSPQLAKVQFSQELSQELLWTLSVHESCLQRMFVPGIDPLP